VCADIHKNARLITQTKKTSTTKPDHLHVGLAIRALMSAEELISPCGIVASDARTPGRTLLEYPIPFDARLSNDIRFFFAGDFKLRTGSAPPMGTRCVPATGADALSPKYASSSACAGGGRRLERRRAFSIRIGPMFERRREIFSAPAAERGVVGGGRRTGLLNLLEALEGKDGRCTPLPLLPLLIAEDASCTNEFKLRSESARLPVAELSPFSSSSLRLPSVDIPRALKKFGSRRLPRCPRVALARVCGFGSGSEKLSWTLSSVFSSSHSFSVADVCAGAEKTELSSEAGVMEMEGLLVSVPTNIDNSRASSRLP
jgi:hypothetical protein